MAQVSRDNAELFLEMLEAINRMDIPGALQFMDPEVRFEHRVADDREAPPDWSR